MSWKRNIYTCLHHEFQCKMDGLKKEDSTSCMNSGISVSSICVRDNISIGWNELLQFESPTRFIPSGLDYSVRSFREIFEDTLLLGERKKFSHQQQQCQPQNQHQYHSSLQWQHMSESEQTSSPRAKRGINTSGWISSFWSVHEIYKSTLLLGYHKSLSHFQSHSQRQYQSSWKQQQRSDSERTTSYQGNRGFNPSGWISYFQAVHELSRATLLLGERNSLSNRQHQHHHQHQRQYHLLYQRWRRSDSEWTLSTW